MELFEQDTPREKTDVQGTLKKTQKHTHTSSTSADTTCTVHTTITDLCESHCLWVRDWLRVARRPPARATSRTVERASIAWTGSPGGQGEGLALPLLRANDDKVACSWLARSLACGVEIGLYRKGWVISIFHEANIIRIFRREICAVYDHYLIYAMLQNHV